MHMLIPNQANGFSQCAAVCAGGLKTALCFGDSFGNELAFSASSHYFGLWPFQDL